MKIDKLFGLRTFSGRTELPMMSEMTTLIHQRFVRLAVLSLLYKRTHISFDNEKWLCEPHKFIKSFKDIQWLLMSEWKQRTPHHTTSQQQLQQQQRYNNSVR